MKVTWEAAKQVYDETTRQSRHGGSKQKKKDREMYSRSFPEFPAHPRFWDQQVRGALAIPPACFHSLPCPEEIDFPIPHLLSRDPIPPVAGPSGGLHAPCPTPIAGSSGVLRSPCPSPSHTSPLTSISSRSPSHSSSPMDPKDIRSCSDDEMWKKMGISDSELAAMELN